MNREQREQIWIDLGLISMLEMMEASCMLAERLTDEHLTSSTLMRGLMETIGAEIVNNRPSP